MSQLTPIQAGIERALDHHQAAGRIRDHAYLFSTRRWCLEWNPGARPDRSYLTDTEAAAVCTALSSAAHTADLAPANTR